MHPDEDWEFEAEIEKLGGDDHHSCQPEELQVGAHQVRQSK